MALFPPRFPTAAQENLRLKNTFLHVDACDDFDLDGSEWLMRRQVSAPVVPTRQLSSQKPKVGILPSFAENLAEEHGVSGDLPILEDPFDEYFQPATFGRQTSVSFEAVGEEMKRQISSTSQGGFDRQVSFDRQISSISTAGLDRQVSAAGFTRQVTEQQWPSYLTYEEQFHKQFDGSATIQEQSQPETPKMPSDKSLFCSLFPDADAEEDHSRAASSGDAYAASQEQASTARDTSDGSTMMPMNPFMMQHMQQLAATYTINNMMWTSMMNQQNSSLMSGASSQSQTLEPPKNRRKANSLITQAQEAQKQKQMEAAQWQLLQQQQLQQQLQGMLGMNANMISKAKTDAQPAMAASTMPSSEEMPEATSRPQSQADNEANPEKKFCPNCGGGVRRHHKFCQSCGHNIAGIW